MITRKFVAGAKRIQPVAMPVSILEAVGCLQLIVKPRELKVVFASP